MNALPIELSSRLKAFKFWDKNLADESLLSLNGEEFKCPADKAIKVYDACNNKNWAITLCLQFIFDQGNILLTQDDLSEEDSEGFQSFSFTFVDKNIGSELVFWLNHWTESQSAQLYVEYVYQPTKQKPKALCLIDTMFELDKENEVLVDSALIRRDDVGHDGKIKVKVTVSGEACLLQFDPDETFIKEGLYLFSPERKKQGLDLPAKVIPPQNPNGMTPW